MPTSCNIRFNKGFNIYYAGEEVSGIVSITNNKKKTIRGIEVKVFGYARGWINKQETRTSVCYKGEEKYIDSGGYVLGDGSNNTFTLEPGIYEYVFKCEIPINSPSSFEGKHGVIQYLVYVKVNRYKMFDNIFKEPFIVILPLNLNFDQGLKLPCSLEASNHFAFLWGKTDTFTAQLSVPFVGYVPGQTVHYKIDIKNDANSDLKKIYISMVQKVNYKLTMPKEEELETNYKLMKKKLELVRKHCRNEIRGCFVMPAVPPSTLDTSTLIRIQYFLKLTIKLGLLNKDFVRSIRLMVGAVPLNSRLAQNTQEEIQLTRNENATSDYNVPIQPPVFGNCVKVNDKAEGYDPFDSIPPVKKYQIKYPVYGHFNSQKMPDL